MSRHTHTHTWYEVKRYFVRPVATGRVKFEASLETITRLVNGYTVVELLCQDCGDVVSRELPGDAT